MQEGTMKGRAFLGVFVIVCILSVPLVAQQAQIDIPQRTDQERWNRSATFMFLGNVMVIAFGKSQGMSIEAIGDWLGKQYAPGWSSNMTPRGLFLGFHRNIMASPTAIVEILAATENELTFRSHRDYLRLFGDRGISYGVTVQEYEQVGMMIDKAIAEHGGLQIEEKIDGMWWVMTVRKKADK
jgi:hypothetical protein